MTGSSGNMIYKRLIFLLLCFIKYSHPVCFRGWWTPLLFTAGIASAKFFIQHVSRQNTLTQARRNISRHYDLVCSFKKSQFPQWPYILFKHLFLCHIGFTFIMFKQRLNYLMEKLFNFWDEDEGAKIWTTDHFIKMVLVLHYIKLSHLAKIIAF